MPTRKRHPNDPRRKTREEVLRLNRAGLNGSEIAALVGISKQRVSQHLQALREAGTIR